MTVITEDKLKSFSPPPRNPERLRIAVSNEFFELYRGDKDFRVGKILCREYGCEVVCLGTDIASPADSRIFKIEKYPLTQLGDIPPDLYLLLMKTRMVWHRRGNISLGGFFRWTPSITRELLKWQPDLILENPYMTLTPRSYQTFLASRLLKIPIIYLDAGDILPKLKLKHKVVLPVEKRVVRQASAIITYNEAGKKRFINKYGYPGGKIHVIPKPVDIEKFHPDLDRPKFREKYDLENKFVVAYFGRLCANKGAKYLLDAVSILQNRDLQDETIFLFVGGNIEAGQAGEFKKLLNRLKLKNIRLTGMIPHAEMNMAYAAADIAVFPNVTNLPGFSTVLAESMASGLPIIIGIKGWEDAVPIKDGLTGMIIEHSNPGQIADTIELLKSDHYLRKSLARNVLEFARREMDYSIVVNKYIKLFGEILGREISPWKGEHVIGSEFKAQTAVN